MTIGACSGEGMKRIKCSTGSRDAVVAESARKLRRRSSVSSSQSPGEEVSGAHLNSIALDSQTP